MPSRFLMITAFSLAAAYPLAAEDAAPPTSPSHFQMHAMGDGIVRLDTVTGQMTYCRNAGQGGETPHCVPMDTSGAIAPQESQRLQARIDELQKKIDSMSTNGALPSDAEVDRSLSIMEKFMRRFMGLAKEFGGDSSSGGAQPQKTL